MAHLYQCRIPLTRTQPRFIVHDEIKDTLVVFKDKFPAIVHMHEQFGSELKSQWAFPTVFAKSFVWDPTNQNPSHYDANKKQFVFTSSDMNATNDTKIFSFIKDQTLLPTSEVPTPDDVMKAGQLLNLRGMGFLTDLEKAQIPIVASWLARSNPAGYTKYLALYPSIELADLISIASGSIWNQPMTVTIEMVLAVSAHMATTHGKGMSWLKPTFTCTENPREHIVQRTRQFGSIYLPQKLNPDLIDYSKLHLLRFPERWEARAGRPAKTERKVYASPDVADVLASFKKMQEESA